MIFKDFWVQIMGEKNRRSIYGFAIISCTSHDWKLVFMVWNDCIFFVGNIRVYRCEEMNHERVCGTHAWSRHESLKLSHSQVYSNLRYVSRWYSKDEMQWMTQIYEVIMRLEWRWSQGYAFRTENALIPNIVWN